MVTTMQVNKYTGKSDVLTRIGNYGGSINSMADDAELTDITTGTVSSPHGVTVTIILRYWANPDEGEGS